MKALSAITLLMAVGCSGSEHLRDIRQLTLDGSHAEAYWSFDGRKLILMGIREGDPADQIYSLDLETGRLDRISTGKGKTTCAYWLPDGRLSPP